MPKFKFVNGVMVKDAAPSAPSAPSLNQVVPLAVIATPEDIADASECGVAVPVVKGTQDAINECSDPSFLKKFKCKEGINEDEVLDRLSFLFAQYEVPIGLLKKLLELTEYNINIILDDSGSMNAATDSTINQAGPFMQEQFKNLAPNGKMTRWQEQEDRLHTMFDFLCCIPTGPVVVSFMNRSNKFTLEHNCTPEQWAEKAHRELRSACSSAPSGGTPTYEKLSESFNNAKGNTMHYLFTDGVPNGGPKQVAELILNRHNAKQNPVALVSCTDKDDEVKWMKDVEEDGPFVSEIDDYNDEKAEVLHDQGPVFPYTKGMWLMCLLVSAINQYDLDALDDSKPMSKYTLDNLLGRTLSVQEYKNYWDSHPKHKEYDGYYSRMSAEQNHAEQIMGTSKIGALSKIAKRFEKFGF
jgi:hypothetical protein